MSLPPSVLLVKRKRDEAPVEALYIERSTRESPKRRYMESAFVFRRLQQQAEEAVSNVVRPAANSGPTNVVSDPKFSASNGIPNSSSVKDAGPSSSTPRRFLLSREALRNPPAISGRRKSRQNGSDLALFVESDTSTVINQRPSNVEAFNSATAGASPARKWPTQKARKLDKAGDRRTQISEAQSQAMERHAAELDMETQPSAHDRETIPKADHSGDAMDVDDDCVVETYVRHSKDDEQCYDIHNSRQRKEEEGLIGYLVIPEADQTLWETYYDSDANSEDEQDWDSEQDDENAENYYGADYPEDEVDSEDEFGEVPYRFHRGGDDEEYGSGDEAWSDDGEAAPAMSWIDITKMNASSSQAT